MPRLLALRVEAGNDEVIVFEVDGDEVTDDLVLATPHPGEVIARAHVSLEEALGKLKPALHKVVRMLKDLAPDEASVEFGLNIGGETGLVVAKGRADVNFSVTMCWKSVQGSGN
jgi:hypothetical protein